MEDYKEEIKSLILAYYSQSGKDHKLLQRTTTDILNEVCGIIPSEPISEHDIFEIMKELLFTKSIFIQKAKVCTFEGDEEKGIPPEFEIKEVGRIFVWNIYEK
jgi:hypothetical protein